MSTATDRIFLVELPGGTLVRKPRSQLQPDDLIVFGDDRSAIEQAERELMSPPQLVWDDALPAPQEKE